ncbi:hypothetical protein HA466_0076630 [Hirschfeldia incana]|nr:hypothetical protein HA466_0076630 [Hirschfeldia incana]
MTEDLQPDPPPLPLLLPDPVSLGPDVLQDTLLSSSSSPMDFFPEASGIRISASSGLSSPLTGSLVFGSLNPNIPLTSVPEVASTKAAPVSASPITCPSFPEGQVGSGSSGSPSDEALPATNSTQAEPAYNWASNLNSASKFPLPSASVSVTVEGKPRVKIPNAVFERGAKLHSDYIVGIFYGKAPSYGKIWAVLNYLWGKDRRVTVHHLAKNAYIFYIPSPSLRKRILQHELWRVGDSPFFVTEWKAEFSLNPPSLDKAPVWAKIQGIPFDLITYEGLSSVCSPLGRVVDAKPFTSISSADVKVIVDLTKPLPSEIELECDDGKILVLQITYPWLPPLCPTCNEIGHKAALCPLSTGKEKQDIKGKGVATDVDNTKDWQAPNKKSRKKKSKKQNVATEVKDAPAGPAPTGPASAGPSSSSKFVYSEKVKVSVDPAPVISPNMFGPLQEESTMEVSVHPDVYLKAPYAARSLVQGSSDVDKSLPVSFSTAVVPSDLSLVPGSCYGQSHNNLHSSAMVLSNDKGINSSVTFCSSPRSSAERKKKKRKFSSPVSHGTSGPGWSLLDNYHHSPLGKIWFIFKNSVTVRLLFADLQSITCEVKLEDGTAIVYTAIYASNEVDVRKDLWISLRDTSTAFGLSHKPWIVGGDFNEILHPDETSNLDISRTNPAMQLFGECLGDLGLFDLPYTGPKYTWTNKRPSEPVGKKLDRCLVNGAWIQQFPSSHCEFSVPEFSDHCPCHIRLSTPPPSFGTRPFRFYNLLIKNPQFIEVVRGAWTQAGPRAYTLRDFCFKLKSLKRPMKSLLRDNYSDIEKRVQMAEANLVSYQLIALNDPSPTNVQMECGTLLMRLSNCCEMMDLLQIRSRRCTLSLWSILKDKEACLPLFSPDMILSCLLKMKTRSNRHLELLSFLTTISYSDRPDTSSWIINGNIQKLFISRLVWEAIRPHLPPKDWASLVWHKAEVWSSICARLNQNNPPTSWNAILPWLRNANSDRYNKIAMLQAWQACVYCLWQERNVRFHSGLTIPPSVLARNTHRIVTDKCLAMVSLGQSLGPPLLRIWKPP